MRLLAVTDAMPQKNWATTAMNTRNLAMPVPTTERDQPRRGVDQEGVLSIAEDDRRVDVGTWHRSPFFGSAAVIARFKKNAAIADT